MTIDVSALPGPIAISGASGFIGSRLCVALASADVRARALVRRPGASCAVGIEEIVVDPADAASREAALRGAHTLVHLAGRAHVMREPAGAANQRFRDANVELTRQLSESAAAAGVSRIVLISSIGAIVTTATSDVSDVTPPAPDTAYGRSKLEAEAVVRAIAERAGLSYVILRPPTVYGPGMKGNPLRLFRAIERGIPLPVAGATNRRSMMYVDNLVAAIVAALRLPTGTRETFVVADSAPASTAAVTREIADALGRPARLLPVPQWLLRTVALAGDTVNRIVPFPLTSLALDRVFGSLAVDDERFVRATGYSPPVGRREAMRRSAEWLREAR